jgi:Tfp pilus assembly protein FimV
MQARPVMAMGALATALSAVIIPSNPAGAASSGPAPLAPNLSPQPSLHGIEAAFQARQISVATYTVRPGDTLSSIAARLLGSERYWPELWWANKKITNPDEISVGQVLTLPAHAGSMPTSIVTAAYDAIPKPPPPVVTVSDVVQQVSQPQADPPAAPASEAPVSTAGDSGFQACVISRESGGNADIWNASGHWGLYQFDAATWYANGGPPGSFGNASQAVQNDVFWNTFRARGTEPWAPSDHC